MNFNPQNPLIVQSDNTLLLEVNNPLFQTVRDALIPFAELIKSPEHIHTYSITPLSLWNGAATGVSKEYVLDTITKYAKYDVPQVVAETVASAYDRYGKCRMSKEEGRLVLTCTDDLLMTEILANTDVRSCIEEVLSPHKAVVIEGKRGLIKQMLVQIGYPVEDTAGYTDGEGLALRLCEALPGGGDFGLREYQKDAVEAFYAHGTVSGGSGVLVLPCGAGKTIIGIGVMEKIGQTTLILVTNVSALKQWKRELLEKTDLKEDDIGEYSGQQKEIKPVTIATYQIMTYRKSNEEAFIHLDLFQAKQWGLIIYDEVHLLPAPVFRETAFIQSKRRLGLTATLVREDGREADVFSLIGPKKYDIPWRLLEFEGWIAKAACYEIRIDMERPLRLKYAVATQRAKYRTAAENPNKLRVLQTLVERHKDDCILIIGQFLSQLRRIADHLKVPLITGHTPQEERDRIYNDFRSEKIRVLVVSKVANFSIDLPEANVGIQVSGTYGSRQEEAQRLGRILRPKERSNEAYFYSLVTRDSVEEAFSAKRQLFLTEQGYRYYIKDEENMEILYGAG